MKEASSKLPSKAKVAAPIDLTKLSGSDLLVAIKTKTTYAKLNVKHNYLNNDN